MRTVVLKQNVLILPTAGEKPADLELSWTLARSCAPAQPGLMHLVRGGMDALEFGSIEAMTENVMSSIGREVYGSAPVVVMLSNADMGSLHLLDRPMRSVAYIEEGIERVARLPFGGQHMLTFHLNTLVSVERMVSKTRAEWRRVFDESVAPLLRRVAKRARRAGVTLLVETTPVPEFGDLAVTDERSWNGVKWRDLRNPFYLTAKWGFGAVAGCGLGVCLDLCHNWTIYEHARRGDSRGVLFPGDEKSYVRGSSSLLMDAMHPSVQLVHLNDAAGLFTQDGGCFVEGVALGEGEIRNLPLLVRRLRARGVPMVLEVNVKDFRERAEIVRSIDWLKERGLNE